MNSPALRMFRIENIFARGLDLEVVGSSSELEILAIDPDFDLNRTAASPWPLLEGMADAEMKSERDDFIESMTWLSPSSARQMASRCAAIAWVRRTAVDD